MRHLLMITGILLTVLLLLAGCIILQPGEPTPANTVPTIAIQIPTVPGENVPLNVSVSPTLYTPSMSSTVGIGLRASYTGMGNVSYRWGRTTVTFWSGIGRPGLRSSNTVRARPRQSLRCTGHSRPMRSAR